MGSRVDPTPGGSADVEEDSRNLGDLLSGRLSDIEVDSVVAVREHRRR